MLFIHKLINKTYGDFDQYYKYYEQGMRQISPNYEDELIQFLQNLFYHCLRILKMMAAFHK